MHSSRMRTVRYSSRLLGVSAWGVSAGGVWWWLLRGDTPHEENDRCLWKHYLAATTLRTVMMKWRRICFVSSMQTYTYVSQKLSKMALYFILHIKGPFTRASTFAFASRWWHCVNEDIASNAKNGCRTHLTQRPHKHVAIWLKRKRTRKRWRSGEWTLTVWSCKL